MRVLVDANFLIHLIDHRESKNKADHERSEKLGAVFKEVVAKSGTIVIPSPVLTEYLLNAGEAGMAILGKLQKNKSVKLAAFDEKAAVTCADLHRAAWKAGGHKRAPLPVDALWQKIKVDWQVVAIAKIERCDVVVTNDADVIKLATSAGLKPQKLDDLPLPPKQGQLSFDSKSSGKSRKPSSQPAMPPAAPDAAL